jgi:hypothetical protein
MASTVRCEFLVSLVEGFGNLWRDEGVEGVKVLEAR